MKLNTKQRKKARRGFEQAYGKEEMIHRMFHIIQTGKQGLDIFIRELGAMLAEAIMDMEREERSGPEYKPLLTDVYKWAYQAGSVYIGDQKVPVRHPRLRGPKGEIPLQSYTILKQPGTFSEELLQKVLRGISLQKYKETVINTAHTLGVSPSTLSRHIVEITTQKLKEFKERDLSLITPFTIFIDTIHRAGEAFMVALGIDTEGYKHVLGFWQGAMENHEICEALLADIERRGLVISKKILWVTDGGRDNQNPKRSFWEKAHPSEMYHS